MRSFQVLFFSLSIVIGMSEAEAKTFAAGQLVNVEGLTPLERINLVNQTLVNTASNSGDQSSLAISSIYVQENLQPSFFSQIFLTSKSIRTGFSVVINAKVGPEGKPVQIIYPVRYKGENNNSQSDKILRDQLNAATATRVVEAFSDYGRFVVPSEGEEGKIIIAKNGIDLVNDVTPGENPDPEFQASEEVDQLIKLNADLAINLESVRKDQTARYEQVRAAAVEAKLLAREADERRVLLNVKEGPSAIIGQLVRAIPGLRRIVDYLGNDGGDAFTAEDVRVGLHLAANDKSCHP